MLRWGTAVPISISLLPPCPPLYLISINKDRVTDTNTKRPEFFQRMTIAPTWVLSAKTTTIRVILFESSLSITWRRKNKDIKKELILNSDKYTEHLLSIIIPQHKRLSKTNPITSRVLFQSLVSLDDHGTQYSVLHVCGYILYFPIAFLLSNQTNPVVPYAVSVWTTETYDQPNSRNTCAF